MKRVKYLGFILAASIALTSVLAGCGNTVGSESTAGTGSTAVVSASDPAKGINVTGVPLVQEKQTLKIATLVNDGEPASEEILFYKNLEKETNVAIEWVDTLYSAWQTTKAIIMASDDLPDAFIGQANFNDLDMLNYGSSEKFITLENYLDTYAPNLTGYFNEHPEWKKQVIAPDGHIYGIPAIDDGYKFANNNVPYINQEWLTKLNLKMPETIDELEAVLKAFKEQDPNGNKKADEIPWSINYTSGGYPNDWMGYFGVFDNKFGHVYVKDGKTAYAPVQPEYKEAVKWFGKLYTQGLVDMEIFTQDAKSFSAKLKAPERIVGVLMGWRSSVWARTAEDKDYVPLLPVKGPSGQGYWLSPTGSTVTARSAYVVTSACKNPELAIRWADNLLTPDNSIQENASLIFGVHIEKTADNKLKEIRPLDWKLPGEYSLAPGNRSRLFVMTKDNVARVMNPPPVAQEKFPLDELLKPYKPTTYSDYPNPFFTAEESQAILQYQTDLNSYVDDQFAKWVTSGGIDAEWDSFVKKLNDMKLQEMLKIYQAALDRMNTEK